MSGSGADAFASGFARGFGIINSFYDRKDKKKYQEEQLKMLKEKHQWDKEYQDKRLGFQGQQLDATIEHQKDSRAIQREGHELQREQNADTRDYRNQTLGLRADELESHHRYRQGMLGIEATKAANYNQNLKLQNRKLNNEIEVQARANRANLWQGVLTLFNNADGDGKKQIEQMLLESLNETYDHEIGAGKRLTSIEMVGDRSPDAGDKVVFEVESEQPDGSRTQSYISQNRSAEPGDPYVALSGDQFMDLLISAPGAGDLSTRVMAKIQSLGGTLPEQYGEPFTHGSQVLQKNKVTNKAHKLGEDKTVTADLNGGLKQTDIDRGSMAIEKAVAISIDAYDNLTDQFRFASEDQRTRHQEGVQVAIALWEKSGYTLNPRLVAYTVMKNGKPMDAKEARAMAEQELEAKGVDSWFGLGGPPDDAIKARAEEILAESKDTADKVLSELAGLQKNPFSVQGSGGGMGQAVPQNTVPVAPKWEQVRPEDRQKMLNNARKDEAYRGRFIELFGEQVWQQNNL